MHELICPKCGASYQRHPLEPAHQELCPACRNRASWEDIRAELAKASKLKAAGSDPLAPQAAAPRPAETHAAAPQAVGPAGAPLAGA